jgi:hypothetical protein
VLQNLRGYNKDKLLSYAVSTTKFIFTVILGCETKNRYTIKDAQGIELFKAKEDTDFCTRQCCGNIRPFDLEIRDHYGREVIHLNRPLACGSCCFPCCLQVSLIYCWIFMILSDFF